MNTTIPTPTLEKSPLKFEFTVKSAPLPGRSGGLFTLCLNDRQLCEFVHWGFSSCGVSLLQYFKGELYYGQGFESGKGAPAILNKYYKELFTWLETHSPDTWKPKEFLMLLSSTQVPNFADMLKDPRVKLIDSWVNKSHGPNSLFLYRISLKRDFSHLQGTEK